MKIPLSQNLKQTGEMQASSNPPHESATSEDTPLLLLSTRIIDECMIAICTGKSCCQNCIATIYRPLLSKLEDSHCTGLVIDKRGVQCSRERKSLDLVAETILLYKHRSPLRKLAIVSSVDYNRSEEVLRKILFDRGLNIRLYNDLDEAVAWAMSYP